MLRRENIGLRNSELLIIIPAYNESGNIEKTIKMIEEHTPEFDYVIINDCSTDHTLEICRNNNFNVIDLPINLGIGGAVQTGYQYAVKNGYQYAVQVDGDGQHNPEFIRKMLQVLQEKNVNMVIGSRFIENQGFQSSFARRIGISFFEKLIKILTGQKVTDPTSGLRVADRKVIEKYRGSGEDAAKVYGRKRLAGRNRRGCPRGGTGRERILVHAQFGNGQALGRTGRQRGDWP